MPTQPSSVHSRSWKTHPLKHHNNPLSLYNMKSSWKSHIRSHVWMKVITHPLINSAIQPSIHPSIGWSAGSASWWMPLPRYVEEQQRRRWSALRIEAALLDRSRSRGDAFTSSTLKSHYLTGSAIVDDTWPHDGREDWWSWRTRTP